MTKFDLLMKIHLNLAMENFLIENLSEEIPKSVVYCVWCKEDEILSHNIGLWAKF
jgi:hypothetical protein